LLTGVFKNVTMERIGNTVSKINVTMEWIGNTVSKITASLAWSTSLVRKKRVHRSPQKFSLIAFD
jgi:hypothetical protein